MKIFDRNWVDAHIRDYYSLTDSGRNRLAAEMQAAVDSRFPDYDSLVAKHDADQAVIEALTEEVQGVREQLRIANLIALKAAWKPVETEATKDFERIYSVRNEIDDAIAEALGIGGDSDD